MSVIDLGNEYEIQKTYVKWAREQRDPRLDFLYATPNEGKRSPAHYQKRKSEGMLAGIADIHLPYPIKSLNHPQLFKYPGLYIETKTEGGKLSTKQIAFKAYCDSVGYPYRIVSSPQEAIQLLKDYLWTDGRQA